MKATNEPDNHENPDLDDEDLENPQEMPVASQDVQAENLPLAGQPIGGEDLVG